MKIILESADNGYIKTILDANSDGNNKLLEKRTIYNLDTIEDSVLFLKKLSEDLGLFMGNKHDKFNIKIEKEYAINYSLSDMERVDEQKRLSFELNRLKRKKLEEKELVNLNVEL